MAGTPSRWALLTGVDKRSLAVFRIAMALTVVGDCLNKMYDLTAFFTDAGIAPRWLAIQYFTGDYGLSVHFITGNFWGTFAIFLVHIALGLAVAVGYKTRLNSVLLWFMTVSCQQRNHIIGHNGDVVMRVMLFFAMFLPQGAVWSLDAALARRDDLIVHGVAEALEGGGSVGGGRRRRRGSVPMVSDDEDDELSGSSVAAAAASHENKFWHVSVAAVAITIQLSIVYHFAYLHKVYHAANWDWTQRYDATFYALSIEFFRTSIGDLFRDYVSKHWLKTFTWLVLHFEAFGSLLYFTPVFTQWGALLGVIAHWGLHIGFGATMHLGMFIPVSIAAHVIKTPPMFWDWLTAKAASGRQQRTVVFNPGCKASAHAAAMAETFLGPALDLRADPGLDNDSQGLVVLEYADGTVRTGGNAVEHLVRDSYALWWLAPFLGIGAAVFGPGKVAPSPARDARSIARHAAKRRAGRGTSPALTIALEFLAGACITYAVVHSAMEVGLPIRAPDALRPLAEITGLEQNWQMFMNPSHQGWQIQIEGFLHDGRKVELFGNQSLKSWDPNDGFTHTFEAAFNTTGPMYYNMGSHRWWKFWEMATVVQDNGQHERAREGFARYVCFQYNNRHDGDDRLHEFNVWYYEYEFEMDRTYTWLKTDKLVGWYCYDHEGGNEFGQDRADAWAAARGAGASGEVAETSPAADEEAVPHEPEAGGGGVEDPPRVSSESGESTAGADETLGGGEDEE